MAGARGTASRADQALQGPHARDRSRPGVVHTQRPEIFCWSATITEALLIAPEGLICFSKGRARTRPFRFTGRRTPTPSSTLNTTATTSPRLNEEGANHAAHRALPPRLSLRNTRGASSCFHAVCPPTPRDGGSAPSGLARVRARAAIGGAAAARRQRGRATRDMRRTACRLQVRGLWAIVPMRRYDEVESRDSRRQDHERASDSPGRKILCGAACTCR
jgi:hypothetical protein